MLDGNNFRQLFIETMQSFVHPWVWHFTCWINPVEEKRKLKNSKLITHSSFMALGFILLLKNNHFKHIQRWKPTQLLLLCVKQMKTDELRVQSKEMKFLCHTALGDPALHSSSSSAWDSPFLSRERSQAQPWCSADQGSHLQLAIQKQIHDEFRGFSSFFCWQSSAGSWTSAAELSLTPEISAWNWVLLPHSHKAVSKGIWPQLNPLKACKCCSSDELDLSFSAQQIQSHFCKYQLLLLVFASAKCKWMQTVSLQV